MLQMSNKTIWSQNYVLSGNFPEDLKLQRHTRYLGYIF